MGEGSIFHNPLDDTTIRVVISLNRRKYYQENIKHSPSVYWVMSDLTNIR